MTTGSGTMEGEKTDGSVSKSRSSIAEKQSPIAWKPVAPDGGYGWIVVLGSFLIHVFSDGFVYSFGVFGVPLVERFGSSNQDVSTILSLLTGLMYAVGPIGAVICHRLGCRETAIIGSLIAAIGCGASFFATRLIHLIFSVGVCMGIGFGLMYCPAIVIVTQYFEKNRSLATGLTVCGSGVGTLIFSKLIGYLIVLLGRDKLLTVFPIYGGVILLGIPCGLLFKPVPLEPVYENVEEEAVRNEASTRAKMEHCCRRLLRVLGLPMLTNACYVLYLISSVLVTTGFNAAPMYLPMNTKVVLQRSEGESATSVSAYGLANIFGRAFFGWICDRQLPCKCGKNRERNRLWIFTAALIASGLLSCLVFLIRDFALFIVFCVLFGFTVSSYASLTSVLLVDLIGLDRLTTGLGLLLLFHGGACVVGPIVSGHLFDVTKNYDWSFAFLGGCLLFGGLLLPLTHLVPGRYVATKDDKRTEECSSLMTSSAEKECEELHDKVW